jgi:hypothetical protein
MSERDLRASNYTTSRLVPEFGYKAPTGTSEGHGREFIRTPARYHKTGAGIQICSSHRSAYGRWATSLGIPNVTLLGLMASRNGLGIASSLAILAFALIATILGFTSGFTDLGYGALGLLASALLVTAFVIREARRRLV